MKRPWLPGVGLRTMKTALSVLLCLLFFRLLTWLATFVPDEGGWMTEFLQFLLYRPNPIFACVAAIIAMQQTVENSLQLGNSRIIGTGIGGMFGLLFLWLDHTILQRRLNILLATVGIIVVINFCLLFKRPLSVPIAIVTFLIIMLTLQEHAPYLYAINRVIDTAVGILVSVGINMFIGRPTRAHEPPPAQEIKPETHS